ncbi:hypothetical protein [Nannocystis bainbridge]|uniref:Tetratricopeptide repeat protein n=1 Tax=Nannocystis bainbridge TaxID=2995303 RepID=A0ABT5DTR0_9BACT|nr:hypothetical protein [Nannocystis bainbridge]MDC0717022.1 hypothetical protein [Nannocystis bainbridge]
MSFVAAIWLTLAPAGWQPRPPDPPTVWAQAGSRPWSQCRELERTAEIAVAKQLVGADGTNLWAERARLCPGAPAVLVAAAMLELTQVPGLPPLSNLASEVEALAEAQRQSRKRAAQWLATARSEASRRGQAPPPMTWVMTAIAAIGLGEPALARSALAQAEARAEVEGYRLDRLAAVAALLAGDLAQALELSHRARERAASRDQVRTSLLLALVYDRSGAADAAQRELGLLKSLASSGERMAVDALLPLHERLYLAAIEQIAFKNPANASLLFKSYLACPEPEAAERKLVERRMAELRPM